MMRALLSGNIPRVPGLLLRRRPFPMTRRCNTTDIQVPSVVETKKGVYPPVYLALGALFYYHWRVSKYAAMGNACSRYSGLPFPLNPVNIYLTDVDTYDSMCHRLRYHYRTDFPTYCKIAVAAFAKTFATVIFMPVSLYFYLSFNPSPGISWDRKEYEQRYGNAYRKKINAGMDERVACGCRICIPNPKQDQERLEAFLTDLGITNK